MNRFQWYRRWRGGKWAQVTGLIWGRNWVRVPIANQEPVDEEYPEK